jgi:DNA-binding transcriptional MerR regulator
LTLDNATVTVYIAFVDATLRYAIGDLAELGGVSRRTVRYYVQEGLLPAPLGLGRGNHYGQEHLDRLLHVKALQEAGHSLDDIKQTLAGPAAAAARAVPHALPVERTLWRRLTLAPGVELHVDGRLRLPSRRALDELAAWCRTHVHPATDPEDSDA